MEYPGRGTNHHDGATVSQRPQACAPVGTIAASSSTARGGTAARTCARARLATGQTPARDRARARQRRRRGRAPPSHSDPRARPAHLPPRSRRAPRPPTHESRRGRSYAETKFRPPVRRRRVEAAGAGRSSAEHETCQKRRPVTYAETSCRNHGAKNDRAASELAPRLGAALSSGRPRSELHLHRHRRETTRSAPGSPRPQPRRAQRRRSWPPAQKARFRILLCTGPISSLRN